MTESTIKLILNQFKAYLDSNSEESDSELSGKEIDSDIENEKQISYDREVYKDDLIVFLIKTYH